MAVNRRPTRHFELTEEEKAVLIDCRRNSIARGLASGLGSVFGLRYLIKIGKVPAAVLRYSFIYYSGIFFSASMIGVASYKGKCLEKLKSLENSQLAKYIERLSSGEGFMRPEWLEEKGGEGEGVKRRRPRRYPDTIIDGNKEQVSTLMKEEGNTAQDSVATQPDSFDSFFNDGKSDDDNAQKKKGRTFDEIREENRSKQLQQLYSKRSTEREKEYEGSKTQQPPKREATNLPKPVRRNKYGDVIYEDK